MPPSKNEIAATMAKGQAAQAGVLSADQVVDHVSTNFRKLYGFTRKMLPTGLPTEPKLYIYSISKYGDLVDLGPGFKKYRVHPCPDGEEYGEPCIVDPLNFFEEAKVDVTEHTFHSGQQIVDSILKVGPGMNAANDRRKQGWFVSGDNPPLDEEIAEAVAIYTVECQRLVQEGNRYASSRQPNALYEITDTHRRAAAYLKQKVEWDAPSTKMVTCPGCGENVKEHIIWHATPQGCGYVFDLKAFQTRFPKQSQEAGHTTQQ